MSEHSDQSERLTQREAQERAIELLHDTPAQETAHALAVEDAGVSSSILSQADPNTAAEIIAQIPEVQASHLLQQLEPDVAARILSDLPSDKRADIVAGLTPKNARTILQYMPKETAEETRALTQYTEDVAGGLMVTEYFSFDADKSISSVIEEFRLNAERYRDYVVQYTYVVDGSERLLGVVPIRHLLWADRNKSIKDLMIADPIAVSEFCPLEELDALFTRHSFFGLPVVDSQHRLLGVVRRISVEEAIAERRESEYRKTQGIVGGEEIRAMPLWMRSSRRLRWLCITIFLNLISASVIAANTDTLGQVITLAAFLPIISDMSGCSGNQAVAVSMRELALGLVRPTEIFRVLIKELSLGVINGLVLGLLIALIALVWQGNGYLGVVVGSALAINTMVAVSLGGILPLALKLLKADPAVGSGPILTSITDMCGFFLALTFAAWMMPLL